MNCNSLNLDIILNKDKYKQKVNKNMSNTIKGECMWAHVQTPNTRFEPRWSIDVTLDKESAEQLEAQGLDVREDDRGLFFCFKRKCEGKNNTQKPKPVVVDAKKNIYTGEIGNGSIVKVQYRPYAWSFGGKKGVGADLIAVQVLELNEYGEDKVELDEEEGFETAVENAAFDDDIKFD